MINAIIGLIILFIVNFFHLMQFAGKHDIGFDWITIIICALAGLPGAILLIILSLVGITHADPESHFYHGESSVTEGPGG